MPRPPSRIGVWTPLLAACLLFACKDGPHLLDPDLDPQVDVSFEIDAAWAHLFDADEVDQLRVTARDGVTGEVLGSFEGGWDAAGWDGTADTWSVEVDTAPTAVVDIVLEFELLGAGDVQWSGRHGPVQVDLAVATVLVPTMYRGPLPNLAVATVDVVGAPLALDEGDVVTLSTLVTSNDPASAGDVRVSWYSADLAVATVVDGLVTGVAPGSASILAVAGPAGDTAVFDVEVVPAAVLPDPTTARLTSLGQQLTVTAAVIDARGDTLDGYPLTWESTDSTVLDPVGAGVFEADSGGTAEVVVSVDGYPGVDERIPVAVDQEVDVVTLSTDSIGFDALGSQQTLTLVAEDAEGTPVAVVSAEWTSADPSIATVDAAGVVTAVANGSTAVNVRVSASSAPPAASMGSGGARAPGMDTVAVSAVVVVDQVVSVSTVTPADSVVLGPGTQVQFTATGLDANGHDVPDAAFTWSSSDGAVATVDPVTGLASTVGRGVTSIEAEADGVPGVTDLTVLTTGGFSRVWIGGDAAGADDWSNADNWLPRLVPTDVDTVLIQAVATDDPRLTSDWTVAGLVLEDGASVDMDGFQLTVTENLDAGNTIVGPGTVRLTGTGASVQGAVPNLLVHGALTVAGPLDVVGDLTIEGAGTGLDVGDDTVSVSGALRVREGGTLTMIDGAALVDVDGEAVFDGASTLGLLTAGELRVGGSFTAWTSGAENFAPTGTHRTLLDGAVIQTVYLHFNGPGEARFQALEIDNVGGVSLQSTTRITGDVTLRSGSLTGDQTAVIDGSILELGGGNQYQVLNTTFTGSPGLPASVQTNATFTTPYVVGQDLEVVGDLMASGAGASIAIGARTVSVTGQLRITEGATLAMQDAAGVLDVADQAFFDGASTLGLLTAGELRVGGTLTAWTSDPQNFAPTGAHRTVLDGTVSQAVYMQHSAAGQSRFQDLDLDNPAGATLLSTTRVTNDLTLTQGTLDGSQAVILGGDLTEVLGGNQYQVLNTLVTGSPTLPASLQTNLTIASAFAPNQNLAVIGNVFVEGVGATLDVGGDIVAVSGDLRTADGGTVIMQESAGLLDVEGEAEFNGGSTLGLLTDGELRLSGNFTAWTSDPENFAPTGAHLTTLDGTAAQTVYLYHSGAAQARFEDLVIDNPAGVRFLGTTRVTDVLTVSTSLTVGLGQTTLVAGTFELEAAATLFNDGSVQANACTLLGTVVGNAPVCP